MQPDLRHMLVLQAQAIDLEGQSLRRERAFVSLNALASAPGVAGDGMDAHAGIGMQAARLDQRAQQRNRTRGVATRVADAHSLGDARRLPWRHLGKAVDPPRIGAMRRRGVDDAHARIADARHRLARGFVGQAQHGHVALVDGGCTRGAVLAQGFWQRDEVDVPAPGQSGPYLQAGGALVTVDKYARAHACSYREDEDRRLQLANGLVKLNVMNARFSKPEFH